MPLERGGPSSIIGETVNFTAREGKKAMSWEKIRARFFAIEVGRQIQHDLPQIADAFIDGSTYREIALQFDIQGRYGIKNLHTAEDAVRRALNGFEPREGEKTIVGYPPLIEPKLLKNVSQAHRRSSSSRAGTINRQTGRGFFALTTPQRQALGRASLEKGLGIHGQSADERQRFSREAVIRRGIIPLSVAEQAFINDSAAKYKDPMGRTDISRIVKELNERFHQGEPVRGKNIVTLFLYREKRKEALKNRLARRQ